MIGVLGLIVSFTTSALVKGEITTILTSNPDTTKILETMNVDEDQVKDLLENKEVQDFILTYIQPLFGKDIDINDIKVSSELLSFVKNNQEMIEQVIGKELPMAEIEEYLTGEEVEVLNEAYKEIVTEVRESVPEQVTTAYENYNYFVSKDFRILMIVVSIVSLITVALLQWSWYKFIRTLGNCLLWEGIVVGLVVVVIFVLSAAIFKQLNTTMTLDFRNGFYALIPFIGVGLLLDIVYGIIKKHATPKQDNEKQGA